MKKYFKLFAITALLALSAGLFSINNVSAEDYSKSNIIDDIVFTNEASMSEADINNFINRYPNSCLLPQNQPSGLSVATFKTPIDYWNYGSDSSASHIIWWAANYYHLNPQVILTTLEKENNLVTGSSDCATWQYNSAMGYNCPDILTLHTYSNIGIVNTCVERESNAGFSRQVSHASWQLRFDEERAYGNTDFSGDGGVTYVGRMTKGYRARLAGGASVYYDGIYTIDGESIYISNGSTASLYNYTPHFNNFYSIFNNFFGSTYANIYNGVNYSAVFDGNYYLNNYPDLKAAYGNNYSGALAHFVISGMSEGRQAKANFNVSAYKNTYQDLRIAYKNNLKQYYLHYIDFGSREGRQATVNPGITPITSLNGVDYTSIYNYNTYISNYSDMNSLFASDDASAIEHFINFGMKEGRQAKANFNVSAYKNTYQDLRIAYKNNLKQYYLHYIDFGSREGRQATVNPGITPITSLNGVDYTSIYNYNTYISNYSDMNSLFASDDASAIEHFINFGMKEGRQAVAGFNITSYMNRYPDLRRNFGANKSLYYMHYLLHGKSEGRLATGDEFNGTNVFNGVDYSNIYDYAYYTTNNLDVKNAYGTDDNAVLSHFINFGMKEGRQAVAGFNINVYKNNYADLRVSYGSYLPNYYLHYMYFGKAEGRSAS